MEKSRGIYLNNAGQARISKVSQEAGIDAVIREPWKLHASEDQKRIRALFAMMIESSENDVAIMPSTAFAITLAAQNVNALNKGEMNKVLLLQDQMASAVYPWLDLCAEPDSCFQCTFVPYPKEHQTWTEQVISFLENDDTITVACLPPLHWSDGGELDLVKVSSVCQKSDVTLVVDATQAVGAIDCSVVNIRPALLACSVHKWLRGPSGVSLVYIDPKLHDLWQPLDHHGRARIAEPDEVNSSLSGYPSTFFKDARKFDSGGKPNPVLLPMIRSAMEEVAVLDLAGFQEMLRKLIAPLLEWATTNDIVYPVLASYHIVGLRPRSMSPEQMSAVCSDLEKKGIYIAVRCGAFRVSPYTDNTDADIKVLIDALSSALLIYQGQVATTAAEK